MTEAALPPQPELWAGFECTLNRVGDAQHDQLELIGHYDRLDDLDRLAELGVRTIGQLQQADEARLATRFGTNMTRFLKARAHFEDDSPVETETGAAKSVSTERTFDVDVADLGELERMLREMSRELCESVRRRGRRGRTIAIKVRLDDWTTVTRARTVEDPTSDEALVTEVAVELLQAYAPPRPVRLLGVRLAGFEDVDPEPRRAPAAAAGQLALEI
jgi:DNA polymerase-4